MKKSNYEVELERLQQRSYQAMIHEREQRNTLRLVQKSASAPAPGGRPAGCPTRRPAPQQPTPPRYFSAQDTCVFLWATREYVCLQCSRSVWGPAFIDDVLVKGCADGSTFNKNVRWLSRVDRPDTRCDVCGRRIHQE